MTAAFPFEGFSSTNPLINAVVELCDAPLAERLRVDHHEIAEPAIAHACNTERGAEMYEELVRLGLVYPVEAEVDNLLSAVHLSTLFVSASEEAQPKQPVWLLAIPIQIAAECAPKYLNGYVIEWLEQSFQDHALVQPGVKVRILSPLFTEADMIRNPILHSQVAKPLGRMLLDDETGALRSNMDSMLPFGSPCTLDEPNYRTRFIVCVCAAPEPVGMDISYVGAEGIASWKARAGKAMYGVFGTWVSVAEPVHYDDALQGAAILQARCSVSRFLYGLRCEGLERALPAMKFKARAISGLQHREGEIIMSLQCEGRPPRIKIIPIPSMHYSMHPKAIAQAAEEVFQEACKAAV